MIIEKIVLDYLSEKLDVDCYLEVPKTNKSTFIVIEKTGSSQRDRIYDASIAIQSYAKSMYEASLLNEKVKEAMSEIWYLNQICRVRLNSDYNYTDTESKHYRYQAVFDIIHY